MLRSSYFTKQHRRQTCGGGATGTLLWEGELLAWCTGSRLSQTQHKLPVRQRPPGCRPSRSSGHVSFPAPSPMASEDPKTRRTPSFQLRAFVPGFCVNRLRGQSEGWFPWGNIARASAGPSRGGSRPRTNCQGERAQAAGRILPGLASAPSPAVSRAAEGGSAGWARAPDPREAHTP